MKTYGLIGKSLTHSFSPGYFREKFELENIENAQYKAFEISEIGELNQLLEKGIKGLNVTIPYKEEILPLLDDLHISAREAGAVNVVKILDGQLIGYNTDVFGFGKSLKEYKDNIQGRKAIVLGTGGGSKAVNQALQKFGMNVLFVSRSGNGLPYSKLGKSEIETCSLLVNTTPLGMYPDIHKAPDIPYRFLDENQLVYDLIYNPEKTLFLARAESQSATIKNGLEMLIHQAEKSWYIWNNEIDLEINFEWM